MPRPLSIAIAHGPHVECTQCCAHGVIRARRHVPYRRRCLRVHPCTHARGRVRGSACACMCALVCVCVCERRALLSQAFRALMRRSFPIAALRAHPRTHVRGCARGSACVCLRALAREGEGSAAERRAHRSERRPLHKGGSNEYSRVSPGPCVRAPSDRIACGRAGSLGA